jgi:hypothetical protein
VRSGIGRNAEGLRQLAYRGYALAWTQCAISNELVDAPNNSQIRG